MAEKRYSEECSPGNEVTEPRSRKRGEVLTEILLNGS